VEEDGPRRTTARGNRTRKDGATPEGRKKSFFPILVPGKHGKGKGEEIGTPPADNAEAVKEALN